LSFLLFFFIFGQNINLKVLKFDKINFEFFISTTKISQRHFLHDLNG
jgi:hypothetical protein